MDINIFTNILNNLNTNIFFTVEPGVNHISEDGEITEQINFLDVLIILHNSRNIETDIYYKETNSHSYLDYRNHHPEHIKNNIPYNLAKRIIVFTSNSKKEEERLKELHEWLIKCNYPPEIIEKSFHNAKLQGPAPAPKKKENTLPFVTTYYNNYSHQYTVQQINNQLKYTNKERINTVFGETQTVLALKQPPNLLRHLTRAKFTSNHIIQNPSTLPNGLFKFECKDKRCNLCKMYIQECKSFTTANGFIWNILCHINCKSKNVLYHLKCCSCNERTSSTGKTNDFRLRMNNHISSCRLGTSSDTFDNHVFKCRAENNYSLEPYFKIYAFMEIADERLLLTYESYLHKKGYDSMN